MDIKRVAVVGAGIMGRGIAQVAADSGLEVTLVDVSHEALEGARGRIARGLGRKLSDDEVEAVLARISLSTDLEQAGAETEHVIEAVTEDIELKRSLFTRLDRACGPDVILATNTSQFSITSIAAATERPDRVIGTHWFNPPPVMRLIEVVRGELTSDETLATTLELTARFGKETIVCQKDTQGFVTSRLIMLFLLEAARIYEEGIASAEDIDKACKLAFNHAMGPLTTADFSGLDTLLRGSEAMTANYGERFRAPQTLRRLVNAGQLGRKSGSGFHPAPA
ncbi:MAG TPA: 3-hydroxyacyl-CoA dehydrogenase family protein [Acidimicrobiales bacterium]|nr:3-hydroxyacyl-CoA dehydrogenase family protein [Acidimicrobiales bacterium]